ncbi:MAG: hypothetical protein BIFFINMI_00072 [Phycisphaerae bacterium]|nr:hypothetical protein [Phycisphaerae bacterium]
MTLMGLQQQRLADLHLLLYSRPFHPELFQIYAAEQYRGAAYEADVWIIGCSHVVTFSAGGIVLTEITATSAQTHLLGDRRLLQRWRLRGEHTCRQTLENGRLVYLAGFQVETLSEHLYGKLHEELVAEGRRKGLLAQFSQWESNGLPPFAWVSCDLNARDMHITSYHGFPDEHCLVKTQSIIELA